MLQNTLRVIGRGGNGTQVSLFSETCALSPFGQCQLCGILIYGDSQCPALSYFSMFKDTEPPRAWTHVGNVE